jgi:iron complex outermembrane receptor protein
VAGVSWWQSAQLFEGNRVTVGVDYQHIYGRAWYTNRETGEVVNTQQRLMQSCHSHADDIAGYVDFRQDLTEWLTIDAGLRYDHHSVAGSEWVPQAGVVVRPTATGEIKAMASKGFRHATPKEMYLYKSANDELEPERLWNYELSWKHRLSDGFTYGANLFYLKGDNMIQTVPVDGKPRNVNTGEIENWGFELEVSYPLCRYLDIRANSAYLHMKDKVLAAPEGMGYLGVDFHKDKWVATLGLQRIEDLYTAVGDNEVKENFWLLNASVTYALARNISLWARGENLLAQKYEINLGYPMPRATFMGGVSVSF